MNLSKSKYTQGIVCNKKLWLSCFKSEEAIDNSNESTSENGIKVGELARNLFGDFDLIEFNKNINDKNYNLEMEKRKVNMKKY